MKSYRLVLQEQHAEALRSHFFAENTTELAAFVSFGSSASSTTPSDRTEIRFLSHEVELLKKTDLVSASAGHVTWDNSRFLTAVKRAESTGLTVGIVHSHIHGPAAFSKTDDNGESGLCELLSHRSGQQAHLLSVVMSNTDGISARIWTTPRRVSKFERISIVGKRFQIFDGKTSQRKSPALNRQALAFGEALNQLLARLRVTVVGCGGTGSAVAMLLARLGVGTINLVDPDTVEKSNLNRLHGATLSDAINERHKVKVVGKAIRAIGLGTTVNLYPISVTNPKCRDALKGSDVIFGCTDDNVGRLMLNRFAYFYLIPVIDMGLAIELSKKFPPTIQALDGRVTVLEPGTTCLLCRGVIDDERARAEFLKSVNRKEYARQKAEAYVIGEGNPAPSVVTFTTEVATMAVTELLQRFTGFRGDKGSTDQRTRLFHRAQDIRPGDIPRDDCPICHETFYWGRGDVEPFLDQVW